MEPTTARDGSKKAVILALLGRPDGAMLAELMTGHRMAGAQRARVSERHAR